MSLTLNKSPADILFQLINAANQTNYKSSDFTLSDPIQVKPESDPAITQITMQPTNTSMIFGSTTLTYNRFDISKILSSKQFQILALTEKNLSDIINEVNTDYGINLTSDDFVDIALPVIDQLNPNVTRFVTVTINPNSIMYYGSYNLQLGSRYIEELPVGTTVVKKFIFISGLLLVDYNKTVISINSDGTTNASFNFLINVSDVTSFTADTLIKTNDDNFTLLGSFAFKFIDPSGAVQSFNGNSFVFNSSGVVTKVSVNRLFDSYPNIAYTQNDKIPYTYVIDQSLANNLQSQSYFSSSTTPGNGVLRFTNDGKVDPTYCPGNLNTPSINYTPSFIRLTDDGKLYTVSNPLTSTEPANIGGVNNTIRIDRLLSNGEIDVTFTQICITPSIINNNPLSVYDLFPMLDNGFLLLIQPTYGLDIGVCNPLINGVPLFNEGVTNGFPVSWNNTIKILETGTLDFNFTRPITDVSSNSLSVDRSTTLTGLKLLDSNTTIGNYGSLNLRLLSGNGNTFTSFSTKMNPVIAFYNIEPVVFDSMGNIQLLTGNEYKNQFMISSSISVQTDAFDNKISFGLIKTLQSDRTYSQSYGAVFRYNPDGSPDKVLFDIRSINFTSTLPVISDVKLITTTV